MDSHILDSYSIAQARDQLPALIHRAEESGRVQLTRRGKPVAMIVSVAHYERLSGRQPDWWEAVEAQRASGGLSGEGFLDGEFEGLRAREPGRPVEL